MSDIGTPANELLKGAVDLHCHSGPSIMPRELDHIEQIRDAEAAGLHAVQLCLDRGFSGGEIRALTSENACRPVGIDPPAYSSA